MFPSREMLLPASLAYFSRIARRPRLLLRMRFSSLAFALVLAAPAARAAELHYNRDVRPILSDHCFTCHGQDPGGRKSELRLDQRDAALKGGKSGDPAIVPGKPDDSELITRLKSTEADEVMPPPKAKNPLTPQQVETLRQWVAGGAEYEPHWAFAAPRRPALPSDQGSAAPIDAFIYARLAGTGLTPSPEAPPETLCRRLYLDLIGLPPSPQEIDAFTRASRENHEAAYEALVDRLLASPQYGEKWARHWLDAARYSDSDGYEKDLPRQQWAWRDWVIKAFNSDEPYDQFIIEQVAGDLLPSPTQDQLVATGFFRNGMVNEEGAIIAEQFRMEGMFDRMDCLGKAVLGLTVQCAQCHSHKFDPLTHEEYYKIFACLNNTYETTSRVYSPEKLATIERIRIGIQQAEEGLKTSHPDWPQRLETWARAQKAGGATWEVLTPLEPEWIGGLAHPQVLPDNSVLTLGFRPSNGELVFTVKPSLAGATGLQLESLTHGDLIFSGPGRSVTGGFAVSELVVEARPPGEKDWKKVALANATADFSSSEQPLGEPFRKGPDDKRKVGPAAFLIDGNDDTAWSPDRGPGQRNSDSEAVLQFRDAPDFPPDTTLRITLKFRHSGKDDHGRLNNFLGHFRMALTRTPNPSASPLPPEAREALDVPVDRRTPAQQATLFSAWRASTPEFAETTAQIEKLWAQFPEADTSVLRLAKRSDEEARASFLLDRGNWMKPKMEVAPGVPAFLNAYQENGEPSRLAFARWLVDRSSPTAARVAVNRIWQAVFGTGLVETPEDFGVRAPEPAEQEALDWLAVDFMEHSWSQKQILREIVTSATYRQSSQASPDQLERDPRNRLLARGPRFRAEAEVVRDIALGVSGLLTQKVGGPSIYPPVPSSLFAQSFADVDFWKTATGPERYRRSLYVFRRRSMPDPVLANFDAPNGDAACARRGRSNTPLATLTSLNETVFVEAAQALALRILREGGATDAERTDYGFRLCTGRSPRPEEAQEILALLASRRAKLEQGWLSPRAIATGDANKLPDLPPHATPTDAAAWTIVARVLLNLDETLTKS